MPQSETLRRLQYLTDSLPAVALLKDIAHHAPGFVQYDMQEGTCLGFALLSEPGIGVQKSFMSSGSIFGEHQHDSVEWLIVYDGHLEVELEDKLTDLEPGGSVRIPEQTWHTVRALRDTWLIGVTVPMEAGYPDANQPEHKRLGRVE